MTFLGALTLFSITIYLPLTSQCHVQTPRRVTVRTPLGDVKGRVHVVQNRNVHQFLGVPYAQPPLDQLRFAKPVPLQPWSGVLDATQFGPSCPQPGERGETAKEDCLYLNIYVRANDSLELSALKPIMVWIHGGGFRFGSGSEVDGSQMASRGGVVVVTLNYRLGMLGWLSTLDDASPGNFGLWDQRVALEWVQDNVVAFGGDPGQITIFGESGGGYSVGLHTVSPLNNGLFRRAIMQSGSALNRRTITLDPRGFAERFGQQLRCWRTKNNSEFDTHFLVQCARQRSVDDIVSATENAAAQTTLAWILPVAPVIDGELIPANIETLLGPRYQEHVPFWRIDIMVGTTNAEGSLVIWPLSPFQRALGFNMTNGIPTRLLRDNITTALAKDYFHGSRDVADALYVEYSSPLGDAEQARQVVDLYGDMMFVSPAVDTLQRHASLTEGRQSHYQYLFSYTRADSGPYPWFRGAGHGAEVFFVFGRNANNRGEALLSLAMLDGWTNFAKFGTPNHPRSQPGTFQWPAFDLNTRAYTDLNLVITSQRDLYSRRMRFWLQTIPSLQNKIV